MNRFLSLFCKGFSAAALIGAGVNPQRIAFFSFTEAFSLLSGLGVV